MISNKTLNDTSINDSLYEYSNQIHLERKRTSVEYLQQHRRWNSVRQKMKDLQMNRIDVTSYRNKASNQSSKMAQQLIPYMQNFSFDLKNIKKKSHQLSNMDIQIRKRKFSCRMIYSSSSNYQYKSSNKKSTYQLKSIKTKTPNKQNITTLQNPETSSLEEHRQILGVAEGIQKIKLSPHQKQKKHCEASVSNQNSTLNANHFKFQISHRKNMNDMINFGVIQQSDENNRVIIRRKSKVDKSCFYLFQSSVVKQKIILFHADVIDGQRMGLKANDSLSHSKNFKLLLGPMLISEYLSLLNLPQNVSELASSTAKLAIILLDYLKIEEDSLKINREGVQNKFYKLSPSQIKDEIESVCKQLESSTCFIQTKTRHTRRKWMQRSLKQGDKWDRRNKFVFDNASQNFSARKPQINIVETPIKIIPHKIQSDVSMLNIQIQHQIPSNNQQPKFLLQNSKRGDSVSITEDIKVVNPSSFGPTISVSQHIQPSNLSEAIKTISVDQFQKKQTDCLLL